MTKFHADLGATGIVQDLTNESRIQLNGFIHPMTRSALDAGQIDPSTNLSLAILYRPSSAQQVKLEQLLKDQQDPSSSQYHKWITPSQYANDYGLPETTVQTITNWLKSGGAIISMFRICR
jgi:subtilase family serine protease